MFVLRPSKDDKKLFFLMEGETAVQHGYIGYLRADFGKSGREFWTTWFDGQPHLSTYVCKNEFDRVINSLRNDGESPVFSSRMAFERFCSSNPGKDLGDRGKGYIVKTLDYSYYFRCRPSTNDYDVYCFVYDNRFLITNAHDAMIKVDKTGQRIDNQRQRLSDLTDQQSAISNEILLIEKSLPQLAKEYADELRAFSSLYMRERFGIEDMHDANRSFLIFDESAQFIKVYRIKQDYEYVDNMEKVLKTEKLYGHNASSWFSRNREFYNLDLREQLKIFGWTFDDNGKVTDARW